MTFVILEEAAVPVNDLVPHEDNLNEHPEENLAAIHKSIETFGQVERLVVRKKDAIVFAGNGRLEVLKNLGIKKARVQFVDGTDAECEAYAVASNRLTRLSRFDPERLPAALERLKDADPSLLLAAGYTDRDLELLLASADEVDPYEAYKGMPEFEQDDLTAQRITMNFRTKEDAVAFGVLIGQDVGENTRSLWHPRAENETLMDRRYETAKEELEAATERLDESTKAKKPRKAKK